MFVGIDFQDIGFFVVGEESFDCVLFYVVMLVCLGESLFFYYIVRFKKVVVYILGVSLDFNFGGDFDIRRYIKFNVDYFEIFDVDKGGVVVYYLQIVFEERWVSVGEIEECFVGYGWVQVLLGVVFWDVCLVKFGWVDEELLRVGG